MKIKITDLTFKCIIGILDFERIKKQKITINITFKYSYTKEYFIDYSEVVTIVKDTMKKSKFLLLEDALLVLECKLYKMYKISNLRIKIAKPDILKDCIVSLSN